MSDMKKMGVLGPLGTHSEAAAQYLSRLLPERPELLVYPDIFAVIQAVEDSEVDSCLVPVENSLEGAINITLDTLARSDDLFVASELIWPVHNQLMARPGTQKICRIYSHPQPISQCRSYLQQHYPEAELIKVASTARAAEIVAKEPRGMGAAAICTKRGGELNGLVTVATEIQDNMANATRFFELRRVTAPPQAAIGPAEKMLLREVVETRLQVQEEEAEKQCRKRQSARRRRCSSSARSTARRPVRSTMCSRSSRTAAST